MVELELLGANGDTVVMTDADGERYSIVIDDALRAAVRRDRAAVLPQLSTMSGAAGAAGAAAASAPLRPRQLQALMRAGATAAEVAASTGMKVDHVRRFEGPVLAERQWAVSQAQGCRIGWETDSPLLGELVVDRLATRGVDPSCLEWDALREGREPWLILVTFIQAAEEKQARWTLDLTTRAVHALDDEARWLTEAASVGRRPAVFDQDSAAQGASAHRYHAGSASSASAGSAASAPSAGSAGHAGAGAAAAPPGSSSSAASAGPSAGSPAARPPEGPAFHEPPALEIPVLSTSVQEDTDALLADLASNRGRRIEVELPAEDDLDHAPPATHAGSTASAASATSAASAVGAGAGEPQGAVQEPEPTTQTSGIRAQVYSMSERRRRSTGNHPAGSRLGSGGGVPTTAVPTASTGVPRQSDQSAARTPPQAPAQSSAASPGQSSARTPAPADEPATEPVPQVAATTRRGRVAPGQDPLPQMPPAPTPKPKRRARKTMPSWDDIVFGAKPE